MHAYQGNLDGVKRIIRQRPETIDYKCMGGDTALLLALRYGHLNIACFLVENGADVKKRNDKKENVMDMIFKHQNITYLDMNPDMNLDMNPDMNLDMNLDMNQDMNQDMNLDMNPDMNLDALKQHRILQKTNCLLLEFLQQGIIPTPHQLFEITFYAQKYNCSELLSYFDHKERADSLFRFFKFNHTKNNTNNNTGITTYPQYPLCTKNESEAVLHDTVFFIHHFMPYDLIIELSTYLITPINPHLNPYSYFDSSLASEY
jgi:hypothetical protein